MHSTRTEKKVVFERIPWEYTDLKLFDAPDARISTADITALYMRVVGEELQFRLEWLELPDETSFDLYLGIDMTPGGATRKTLFPGTHAPSESHNAIAIDTLIIIKGDGEHQVQSSTGIAYSDARLRIERNPSIDTMDISIYIPEISRTTTSIRVHAWTMLSQTREILDDLPVARFSAPPPPRLPILLAFWNTFPAVTPAQSLRRWDGAHTGPLGERHGLRHLLAASRRTNTPLFLLDLKTPEAISALDYLDVVSSVRQMASTGLLILPQVATGISIESDITMDVERMLNDSRAIGLTFDLPASALNYIPQNLSKVSTTSPHSKANFSMSGEDQQATRSGPSISLRKSLVSLSIQSATRQIAVLGGSLPETLWGDALASIMTLEYLRTRPWLWFLTEEHIAASGGVDVTDYFELSVAHGPMVSTHPQMGLVEWQMFRSLNITYGDSDERLPSLRKNYLGQLNLLKFTEIWANSPRSQVQCDIDLNMDDKPECILASKNQLAILDPELGELSIYAVKDTASSIGYTQIIGPFYQFASGYSDPPTWEQESGLGVGSETTTGAFGFPWMSPFRVALMDDRGTIRLENNRGKWITFTLNENGLRVEGLIDNQELPTMRMLNIPIALSNPTRFFPDWAQRYESHSDHGQVTWSLSDGFMVDIQSNMPMRIETFSDTPIAILQTEDADRDYPPGHFLPFPMALVEIEVDERFEVMIKFYPKDIFH